MSNLQNDIWEENKKEMEEEMLEVGQQVLANMKFKGEVKKSTFEDITDDLINDIEDKFGFHVCMMNGNELTQFITQLQKLRGRINEQRKEEN